MFSLQFLLEIFFTSARDARRNACRSHIKCLLFFFLILAQMECAGRAKARAVSRRLTTTAARARTRVWSCEICGGQSGTGAGFLRVLRFPLPVRIPPATSQSSSVWGWYSRRISGQRTKWAQSHPMRKIKLNRWSVLKLPGIKLYVNAFSNSLVVSFVQEDGSAKRF
jgi:hypothetical protein